MNNQNDIYSLLKKSGLNADALLRAAKNNDSDALLKALSPSDRNKVEKLINSGEAEKMLSGKAARDIINRFGEKSNG